MFLRDEQNAKNIAVSLDWMLCLWVVILAVDECRWLADQAIALLFFVFHTNA